MPLAPQTEIYSTMGGDPDFGELVEMYVDEMPERLQRLQDIHREGNYAELNRLAHQIKGSAGGYGFDEITPYAARLERAATRDPDMAELEGALHELLAICRRIGSGKPA